MMNHSSMEILKKFIICALAVVAVVIPFVPFESRFSNQVVVRFMTMQSDPVSGVNVSESWESFGGQPGRGHETDVSDEHGVVRFPWPTIHASAASRAAGWLMAHIAVHAGNGNYFRISFGFVLPRKAIFNAPTFKPVEPVSTTHRYTDSSGRDYEVHLDGNQQRFLIAGDFLHLANEITINVE